MISILIRTSNRPALFKRALQSVKNQTYKDIRVIVSYDNDEALKYIPAEIEKIKVSADKSEPYFYDLYCNDLKELVTEGWFMFLDDDDYLYKDCLKRIAPFLSVNEAIICQFLRGRKVKPSRLLMKAKQIIWGKIGMPCIILHHSHKNIAQFCSHVPADYIFIKEVSEKLPVRFVPVVVVAADRRSKGL